MHVVRREVKSVRLKCSKSIVQDLDIPERGYVLAHMRGYSFQARHDISGSSLRVNLGTAFAPLLHGEDGRINVVLKVLNGNFEIFYKEDEKALYPPQISRPDYEKGFYYCIRCMKGV